MYQVLDKTKSLFSQDVQSGNKASFPYETAGAGRAKDPSRTHQPRHSLSSSIMNFPEERKLSP